MSEVLRLYRYRSLLSSRRATPAADIMAVLEISPATFKRDIAKLRDQLNVPIRYDSDLGGYILDRSDDNRELPGLWFSPQEILALLTVQQLLQQLEPSLVGAKLRPLQNRLEQLMQKNGLASQDVAKRIRILHAGKRRLVAKSFEIVAAATMARKRLHISHLNRQNGSSTQREVSPQRLVYYRDNWYLDAWCHLRDDIRSFSLDVISDVDVLEADAQEIESRRIDETLGVGYGIFNGAANNWAKLRFTPERARWVAGEVWHVQQESHFETDGSYVLSFPYADDRELIGDVLRFGADVEVLGPADLRLKVIKAIHGASGRYL